MRTEDGFELPDGKLPYPVRPGDAPFRSLERLIDSTVGKSLVEAKREIRSHAVHELELLDSLHQDLVRRAQAIIDRATFEAVGEKIRAGELHSGKLAQGRRRNG